MQLLVLTWQTSEGYAVVAPKLKAILDQVVPVIQTLKDDVSGVIAKRGLEVRQVDDLVSAVVDVLCYCLMYLSGTCGRRCWFDR